jgi:hypothetical protein
MLSTDAYAYLNVDDPICAWAAYRSVLVSVAPNGEDDLIGGISVMSGENTMVSGTICWVGWERGWDACGWEWFLIPFPPHGSG